MPIYKGTRKIKPVFKGEATIARVFKGDRLVYDTDVVRPSTFYATVDTRNTPDGQIREATVTFAVTVLPRATVRLTSGNGDEFTVLSNETSSSRVQTYTFRYGTANITANITAEGRFSSIRISTGNACSVTNLTSNGKTISGDTLTSVARLFANTINSADNNNPNSKISQIPTGYFNDCPNIETFDSCFENNTALYGSTPVDENGLKLWQRAGQPGYPTIITGTRCFYGCTNLSDYADIPADWK